MLDPGLRIEDIELRIVRFRFQGGNPVYSEKHTQVYPEGFIQSLTPTVGWKGPGD